MKTVFIGITTEISIACKQIWRYRMQAGYILLCFFAVTLVEAGDMEKHQKKIRGPPIREQHYRLVTGEIFVSLCNADTRVKCSRIGEEGTVSLSFDCMRNFSEGQHSGHYTCHRGSPLSSSFNLQVVNKTSLQCPKLEESSIGEIFRGEGGQIPCPGLNCYKSPQAVNWYQGDKHIPPTREHTVFNNGTLQLATVNEYDTGVYFCERQIAEQNISWIFRRPVYVTVSMHEVEDPPNIVNPQDEKEKEQEVELGQNHTLICKVNFPVSRFSLQWYMNYGGNLENMTLLDLQQQQKKRPIFERYEVIQVGIIKEVTRLHLSHTYTCFASNSYGNRSVTVKLKEKSKAHRPSLVAYPVVSLLLVAGLGVTAHVKWLELQLIYRSYFQRGKLDGEDKEFDVFLSYVWSPPSADVEEDLTHSSPSGPDTEVEACLSSLNPQKALQVLLPRVLEDQWGYRLCLLERDVLPGGAYTNDVVHSIQRSKMLICLLSDDYFSNSNAVFVLESGIQVNDYKPKYWTQDEKS